MGEHHRCKERGNKADLKFKAKRACLLYFSTQPTLNITGGTGLQKLSPFAINWEKILWMSVSHLLIFLHFDSRTSQLSSTAPPPQKRVHHFWSPRQRERHFPKLFPTLLKTLRKRGLPREKWSPVHSKPKSQGQANQHNAFPSRARGEKERERLVF